MSDETAGIGHNSERFDSTAGARIRSFIERIERLTEDKQGLGDDIKEVFAEAKGVGFDVKTMRKSGARKTNWKSFTRPRSAWCKFIFV
jgi:uncharacterized protein (UPF0335 family)